MTQNVEDNKLKNVVLYNAAVSNKKEIRKFIVDENNLGNSRLDSKDCHANARNDGDLARDDIIIKCVRLEEILKNEQKIDLIKIDTQGWEPAVIRGTKKIIERDLPTLFLEYSPAEYKDEEMKKYLEENYKNIWSIDYWFYRCRKGIWLNKKTGYTDLWIKNKMTVRDYWWTVKKVRIKKVLKVIAVTLLSE